MALPSMNEWQIPKSWENFENLSWDLMRAEWQDPNASRNGRQGQRQKGVDIFGQRNGQVGYIGVQCKLHGRNAKLTLAEVEREILKAEEFEPPLKELLIATTAPRDATLQKAIRLYSEERRKSGKFPIFIRFWDDIEYSLALDEDVAKIHYPEYFFRGRDSKLSPPPGQQSSFTKGGKLQLFVSSRINRGLNRERLAVISALEDTSMANTWHWERDGYETDEGYLTVCTKHVHASDGLVLILAKDLSSSVMAEYVSAKAASRPCYVMIKDGCRQDENLQRFLDQEQPYVTIRLFKNLSELKSHVIETISSDMAESWRSVRMGRSVQVTRAPGENP